MPTKQRLHELLEENGVTPEAMNKFNPEKSVDEWREVMIQNGLIKQRETPHVLVTVSLPDDYDCEWCKLPETVERMLRRNESATAGNSVTYSLEFYGKTGFRPHIHLLIHGAGTNTSKIVRMFSVAFKVKSNFVNVQRSKREDLYITREKYVKGEKTQDKMDSVNKDDEFRKKHDIKKYYEII